MGFCDLSAILDDLLLSLCNFGGSTVSNLGQPVVEFVPWRKFKFVSNLGWPVVEFVLPVTQLCVSDSMFGSCVRSIAPVESDRLCTIPTGNLLRSPDYKQIQKAT